MRDASATQDGGQPEVGAALGLEGAGPAPQWVICRWLQNCSVSIAESWGSAIRGEWGPRRFANGAAGFSALWAILATLQQKPGRTVCNLPDTTLWLPQTSRWLRPAGFFGETGCQVSCKVREPEQVVHSLIF